ncbi:MAG: hypothetical protein FJY66_03760, partial [Calditrichaeota bacterium]|nr:hypothetical protein [Calditrichota bacterium]
MKKRVVFLFLLISMMVSSSRALQGAKALEQIGPQFHCRVGHFLTNTPDSVRLLVAIAVPYDNLQFIRSDSGFSAFFELVSSVYDSQGVLIAEKMSYPKARTTNYAETNLMTKVVAHTDDFLLGPGDYRVRVVLTERESNRESRFEAKMPLRATDPLLQLSDIFWAAQETSAHDLGDLRVVDLFFTDEDSALARFQTASTGKESLLVRWQIRGASGADTLERHQFRVAAGAEPATRELRVDLKGLTGGGYHLHVEAEANSRRIERKLPFRISLRGMPRSIVELDLAIR